MVRRALLRGVNQADYMTAVSGDDRSLWRVPYGFFAPGSVMASDEGLDALRAPLDAAAVRRALAEAGYRNERVTLIAATDFPVINAMCEVVGDMFRRVGINLDYVATDWGSTVRRMLNQDAPERGGWNATVSWTAGSAQVNPAANNLIRGHGRSALFGWPTSPELERLREQWFDTTEDAARADIGRRMQAQAFQDVPYVPLGQFFSPTAFRADLDGMLKGVALFYGIRRTT